MVVTFSWNIRFTTVQAIPNRTSAVLLNSIKSVIAIYQRGGFRVRLALMDGEFASMTGAMADLGVSLNTMAEDEHVGEIERFI
jgi:hypothetical protein